MSQIIKLQLSNKMATQSNNKFDPIKLGAVPVQNPNFNPAQYGATPADPAIANPTAQDKQSLIDFAKKTATNIQQPFVSVAATPVQILAKSLNLPDPYEKGVPTAIGIAPVAPTTPAGFLQKAGQVGQIASMLAGPETAGVFKTGALYGAMGASNDIAGGSTNPTAIARDAIWASIFGLGVGTVGNFASHIGNSELLRTGVTGVNQDAIAKSPPSLVANYINAAKNHGDTMASLRQSTPVGLMEDEFDKRASILTDKVIPKAGEAVGAAKQAAASSPIIVNSPNAPVLAGKNAAGNLFDDINSKVMAMTGHGFGLAGDVEEGLPGLAGSGEHSTPTVYQLPGREVQLSSTETKQLQDLQGYLGRLQEKPTAGVASDILTNINRDIGKWNNPQFGEGNSPVQGALKYAYGAINNSIRGASPELAAANSTYHELMNLKDQIKAGAGQQGQSAALLMRRVLSGDKSATAIPTLDALDAITAPYRPADSSTLVQHAVLGKWATDMFGGPGTKQLFAEGVKEGQQMAGGISSVFGWPRQFISRQLDSLFTALAPDPAEYAMSVAKGAPYSMNPITRNVDELLNKEINTPGIGKIVTGLQDTLKSMGVTAHNIEPVAKALFKTWLLNRLTQPKPSGFPLQTSGVPNTILPSSVPQNTTSLAPSPAIASTAQNLTPATTGQGMASQARTQGLSGMPNGTNLGTPGLSLS